jgi:ribosomal protein L16 Arg81 hydroxylase
MKQIDQRSDLQAEEFVEEYLRQNKPVLLKNAAPYWRERWTPQWLKQRFGDRELVVETGEEFVENRTKKTMTLAELIDSVLGESQKFRARNMKFLSQVPELQNEWQEHNQSESYLRGEGSPTRAFWIVPNGNNTAFHHDHFYDNMNVQIFGRKQFILTPPSSYKSVYPHMFSESLVDPRKVSHDKFPRFAGADLSEAWVEPGDVIFIPQFWWHFVVSLGLCINVNSWVKAPVRAVKEVTSQMPLVPRYFYQVYYKDSVHKMIARNVKAVHFISTLLGGGKAQPAGQ